MKLLLNSLLILAFLFITPFSIYGQTNFTRKQYAYKFAVECPIQKCTLNGKKIDSIEFIAPANSKFVLIDAKGEYYIIRFFVSESKNQKKTIADYSLYNYYLITKFQFEFKSYPLGSSDYDLVFGSIYTPIKVRSNPFDFSKDFTIGSTFGLRRNLDREKQLGIDLLIGIGLSSVSLDSFSTSGKVYKPIDVLAFTPALGLVAEIGNAQVGFFCGSDMLNAQNGVRYDWIYQGKVWWSFGIGYTLVSFDVKK
ncbi:MAG: hypothetical protein CFE21_11840 [Bacteroidetes bacterium B1(2017)]|nr:MAG: hypothetical protein CFE21_11840 [Bacteroidetes bacterium B1(2017)]